MPEIEKGSAKFGDNLAGVLRRVKQEKYRELGGGTPISAIQSSEVFSEMCGVDSAIIRSMEHGLAFRYGHVHVHAVLTAMLPYFDGSDADLVDLWLFDGSIRSREAVDSQRDCGREIELSASLIVEGPDGMLVHMPSPVAVVEESPRVLDVAKMGRLERGWASRV